MKTEPNTKDQYWAMFVVWLKNKPYPERVQLIQQCVQEVGPCPDSLGDEVRKLLTP